jgi:hypothetical protein
MLGKCTNPSCFASFRYLEEGMLFRLETDRTQRLPNPRMPEYYWLCRSCSKAMTLHISKEGNIVMMALPLPVQRRSHGPDFTPSHRQKGLVLSGVSFSTERHRRGPGYVG